MRGLDTTLLICPTYNPGKVFYKWLAAYQTQNFKPKLAVIVDSSSDDGALSQVADYDFQVETIKKDTFNHGGTRQQVVNDYQGFEYVIFLTQDAILSDVDSLKKILGPFSDENVAAVCGRQLPRESAVLIEAHARIYNYSSKLFSRSLEDVNEFGLKTAFISNSFAAYRVSVLNEIGGFPDDVIFGEDMYVATKMLKAGYQIAYAANACVYHSHSYTIWQEMKRYFDMGVFHAREPWIRQTLGGAEGEGIKFLVSELKYLLRHAFWQVPEGFLRTVFRYIGFRLGLMERKLPLWLKRRMAMNKGYFK